MSDKPDFDTLVDKVTVSDEHPDDEDALIVCALKATKVPYLDNLFGECSECGAEVQFRPHAPKGKLLCFDCFVVLAQKMRETEEVEIHLTTKAAAEVLDFIKHKISN